MFADWKHPIITSFWYILVEERSPEFEIISSHQFLQFFKHLGNSARDKACGHDVDGHIIGHSMFYVLFILEKAMDYSGWCSMN